MACKLPRQQNVGMCQKYLDVPLNNSSDISKDLNVYQARGLQWRVFFSCMCKIRSYVYLVDSGIYFICFKSNQLFETLWLPQFRDELMDIILLEF